MSLRKRLIHLLMAYLAFVVLATVVAIYGTQINIAESVLGFDRVMSRVDQVERLRITAREQIIDLREIVAGEREVTERFSDDRRRLFVGLEGLARVAPGLPESGIWEDIRAASRLVRRDTDQCLTLLGQGRRSEARTVLDTLLAGPRVVALNQLLNQAAYDLSDARRASIRDLGSTNVAVHLLAILVAVAAIAWLLVGAHRIRRMLIDPITKLRDATQLFKDGDLNHRVALPYDDELGSLGAALNSMAVSLSKAQADLHKSEAKHRALFNNLRDAVVICDVEGCVVECHSGDAAFLRSERGDPVGHNLLEAWPEWGRARVDWRSAVERVVRTGDRVTLTDVAIGIEADAESDVVADIIVYPVEYDNATYAAIVLRDVTERERLHRRLRHADKMEATGTLAGGVAHDFNNLLTSAIGTLSLLGGENRDPRQDDLIQTALRGCWQAANLSRRLLDFASGGYRRPQVLRLREVVELVLDSLDTSLVEGVRIVTEFDEDVLVQADKDQLTQIILNLVHNACDAMPEGGELRITARTTTSSDPDNDGTPTRHALLTVADTGGGMTPDVKERLFEPFFTTKARANHRGRGLGLAIVYASVKSARGFIQVESELAKGTSFHVHLPMGEGLPDSVQPPVYVPPTQRGEGTILVVDDEPMIVQMCAEALRKWGYGVICADSVGDAARKFDEAEGTIALALIDINLPDGSGVVLAEDLITLDPHIRVVFATGYAEADVPAHLDSNVSGRLSKPFALDELAGVLSSALASTSAE